MATPSASDTGGARDAPLQRLALVERHDGIEPRLPLRREFDHFADAGTAHPRRDPRLAQEGEAEGVLLGDARGGKFQDDGAVAAHIRRAKQAAVAAVRQHRLEAKVVDRVAFFRKAEERQAGDLRLEILRFRRRDVEHIEDERGGVVGTAGGQRGVDDGARGLVRACLAREMVAQPAVVERAMHAVAAQQKAVAPAEREDLMIDTQIFLGPDGARQHMFQVAAPRDMVVGETFEPVFVQPVDPAVADMDDMGVAPVEDERRECRAHVFERGIGPALRENPSVDGFDRARRRAARTERFGHGVEGVDEGADRRFRGFASALVAADAVRHRRDDPASRRRAARRHAGAHIVLIFGSPAGLRRETDADLQAAGACRRHGMFLSVRWKMPAVY